MTWPDLRVQVAFDSNPMDSGRVWTDITSSVLGVTTEVGRQRELDEYDPGTAVVTLDNSSRLFDPLNASGTYYGNLLPGKPIRVGLGYPYLIAQDAPVSYWRFDEGSGLFCYDETGYADATIRATGTWTDTGLLNAGTNRALLCDGTNYNGAYVTTNKAQHSVDTTGELTVEAWVNLDTVAANQAIVARQSTSGGNEWIMYCNSAGYLVVVLYNTASGNYAITGNLAGVALSAATTYHVAFTWDGTTLRVYRNGVQGATDSSFSGTLQGNVANTVTAIGHRDTASPLPLSGTVDEVAIYDRALDASELLAHYTEGSSGSYETNLFVGFVDGWPQDYADDDATELDVKCTDGFGMLARYDLPGSVYELVVRGDTPWLWWRVRETQGSVLLDSSGNGFNGSLIGTATSDLASLERVSLPIYGANSEAVVKTNVPGIYWAWEVDGFPAAASADEFTVEFWLYTSAPDPSWATLGWNPVATLVSTWTVTAGDYLGSGNMGRLQVTDNVSTRKTSADVVHDGSNIRHVAITYASGSITFYVDGAAVSSTGTAPNPPTHWKWIFHSDPSGTPTNTPPLATGMGEIAVYASGLSSSAIASHYSAATAPWDGDTTGARVDRILDLLSWPATHLRTATGQTSLGVAHLDGRNALDYLQSTASSEQGQLFCDPADTGKVTFRDRHHRLTATRSTASQYTFTDDGTGVIYERATVRYDERQIINECNVEWQGGTATYTDSTSGTSHGLASKTIKTELATYAEALNLAEWVVARYKDPTVRVSDIELTPAAVASAFPAAINTRIDDRVTFEKTPQGVGSAIERDVIVEGVTHKIDNGLGTWETTLYTSEADSGPWFVWGTSTWDTDTRWAW